MEIGDGVEKSWGLLRRGSMSWCRVGVDYLEVLFVGGFPWMAGCSRRRSEKVFLGRNATPESLRQHTRACPSINLDIDCRE